MILAWPQTKSDESSRIGNRFALPAVIRLKFAHGFFAGLVPSPGSLVRVEIMLANQRLLDFPCAIRINLLLAAHAR
jgi:hypothetical protein